MSSHILAHVLAHVLVHVLSSLEMLERLELPVMQMLLEETMSYLCEKEVDKNVP